MVKFCSIEEAISLINDGDTIWVNGFLSIATPDQLNRQITRNYRAVGHPRCLSVYASAGFAEWLDGSEIEGYITDGAVDRLVLGHYGSMTGTNKKIMDGELEAYNLPLGVMSHMVRAAANGSRSHFTKVGLGIFVDPEVGSAGLNEKSNAQLVRHTVLGSQEGLLYDVPEINVGLIKGSYADEDGNISFMDECCPVDALAIAQAVRSSRGKLIAQVAYVTEEKLPTGEIVIPGSLVDAIVVCPEQTQLTNIPKRWDCLCARSSAYDGNVTQLKDEITSYITETSSRSDLHTVIAGRAYRELEDGQMVNIGIGTPEMVGRQVLAHGRLDKIHMCVEAGPIGGMPLSGKGFGGAICPDSIHDMPSQFDFFNGGGLDITLVGALEVDAKGNVNSHSVPGTLSGIGGFANVTQNTKKIVFCFTFNAGGIRGTVKDGKVNITSEGRVDKFVPQIKAVSFSAENALKNGQEVMYVTERCVFRLGKNGLILTEVAPGIDLQKDILDRLSIPVEVSDDLTVMEF